MAEQPELDLPPGPAPASLARPARRRAAFAGFSRTQIVLGAIGLAALVWSLWVTKLLMTPQQDHIVSARLSSIVGEYVQAQARSASPPAQVEAEMRTFMASLDKELQRRSAGGQVVLVGEAVLTRNVPDITEKLKAAVYASGISRPRQASAEELQRMEQLSAGAPAPNPAPRAPASLSSFAPTAAIDPMAAAQGGPAAGVAGAEGMTQPYPAPGVPGASVATFGGPDGTGGR